MSRTLTAQDRASLIRRASSLPAGSAERKAILAGLGKTASATKATVGFVPRFGLLVQLPGSQVLTIALNEGDLRDLMQGMSVSTDVGMPANDETPAYVQKEVNTAINELRGAVARLTHISKKF
jgi:hypothetical protein